MALLYLSLNTVKRKSAKWRLGRSEREQGGCDSLKKYKKASVAS